MLFRSDVLRTCQLRWAIESAFSAMKARGLNLEATHMTAPERISRLFGLLCIALAWMTRIGAQRTETCAPRQDKRGRAVVSVTRIGWQILSQAARWGGEVFWDCLRLLRMPFSTASTSVPEVSGAEGLARTFEDASRSRLPAKPIQAP